jgi:hypothetical protein
MIISNLKEISQKFGDNREILNDLNLIKSMSSKNWREPDSWHTTCLYVGQNTSALYDPIYVNFVEGVQIDLDVNTMIYIPNKIISAPVFPNYKLIQNKFPHITLLMGKYQAVDSNYVMEAAFGGADEQLRMLYQNGFIKDASNNLNIELNNVKITFGQGGRTETVPKLYLIKPGKNFKFEAFTKKNY